MFSQVVMGDTRVTVYHLDKMVNFFFRNYRRAKGAGKIESAGVKIPANSPDNASIFQVFHSFNNLIFRKIQTFSKLQKRLRNNWKVGLDFI